jgi:zinc transporter
VDTLQSAYGSDQHGLVWGYLFTAGQIARPLDSSALIGWPAASQLPHDSFLWLHFSLSNAATEPWLRQNLQLPEAFYESFRVETGSTRLEQDAETLVAVVYDVLFDFSFDASSVSTASLCLQPQLLISARRKPLRSIDRLRASVKTGQSFRSPAELLAHLLQDQANVLVDIVRRSTARVDVIEDTILANRISVSRSELGALRRMLVRLQRLLAPEPAAFFRLLNRPPGWIGSEDLQELRQAAEEFSAAVTDAAALVERVKLLQEELAGLVSEQTNRTLFILTVVTVLALPVNMVAGLFGMNVGGIPLGEHGEGFLIIVTALVAFTVLLAYLALGRRRD